MLAATVGHHRDNLVRQDVMIPKFQTRSSIDESRNYTIQPVMLNPFPSFPLHPPLFPRIPPPTLKDHPPLPPLPLHLLDHLPLCPQKHPHPPPEQLERFHDEHAALDLRHGVQLRREL